MVNIALRNCNPSKPQFAFIVDGARSGEAAHVRNFDRKSPADIENRRVMTGDVLRANHKIISAARRNDMRHAGFFHYSDDRACSPIISQAHFIHDDVRIIHRRPGHAEARAIIQVLRYRTIYRRSRFEAELVFRAGRRGRIITAEVHRADPETIKPARRQLVRKACGLDFSDNSAVGPCVAHPDFEIRQIDFGDRAPG